MITRPASDRSGLIIPAGDRSGQGIEAQRKTLGRFAASEGFELRRVFVEVETVKGADALDRRPQLAAALAEARRQDDQRGLDLRWTVRECSCRDAGTAA
jgi:hypothetical protein